MSWQPGHVCGLLMATTYLAAGVLGQTTVSVWLPAYSDSDWEALRGSILNSDQSATTYTVFCADVAPRCQIAGDLPFVFTEGPSTLKYTGAATGEITADLQCNLQAQSAATCTGSSSLGPNFHEGSVRGPTRTVWTSTFTGTNVAWGVLTLATPGSAAGTTDIDGTAVMTGAEPTSVLDLESGTGHLPTGRWLSVAAGAVAAVLLLW
ncbi:hypothetical protein OQA88_13024 [Cercophora sp. LCS_1]